MIDQIYQQNLENPSPEQYPAQGSVNQNFTVSTENITSPEGDPVQISENITSPEGDPVQISEKYTECVSVSDTDNDTDIANARTFIADVVACTLTGFMGYVIGVVHHARSVYRTKNRRW